MQKHKLAEELTKTMGADFLTQLGYDEKAQELGANYESVRDRFLVDHCDHCTKKKVNFSWSQKSLLEMAAKAGRGIRSLTFEAYYIPLEHTHSSIAAILHRLEQTEDGSITFKDDVQRAEADLAVQFGYLLLLNVLGLQHDYFKLDELKAPLDKCFATYREIYLAGADESGAGAV